MNGRKMSKSDGNTITPQQLFTGDSPHISKSYSPMVIRFFMLQSHYSSTNDLTDDGLLAAEKGYKRLTEAAKTLSDLSTNNSSDELDQDILKPLEQFIVEMCDDFNTPRAIALLFELVTKINSFKEGHLDINKVSSSALEQLKDTYPKYLADVLGLENETVAQNNNGLETVMKLVLDLRQDARTNKNCAIADKIRDALAEANITVKDGKDGSQWTIN